jgi:SNF2 family DNA or RNA helicase
MLGEIDPYEKYAFHQFGLDFCNATQTEFGWNYNGTSNREYLHQILRKYMIRRLKKNVLPHLRKQRQFIPIAEISAEYKKVEKEVGMLEPGVEFMGKTTKARRLLSRVKIKPAIDLAENYVSSDESIVVVTEFRETLEKIAGHFGKNACTICGDMTDKEKQKAIDDFQSGKKKVCVINMIAGGVGVTLTKAHNMIICDYDWTPANMVQVEDRICRAGQQECCNIYYLYCENSLLDKAFVRMISRKSEDVDRVVDNSHNTNDFEREKNESMLYYEFLSRQYEEENRKNEEKVT